MSLGFVCAACMDGSERADQFQHLCRSGPIRGSGPPNPYHDADASPLSPAPADRLRRRVVREAEDLFSHADDPLADTLLYAGDPGLFGPGSITWELMGDASTFIGGIRALLVQAAHPEVVAGVADHSRYREDPLGRLSRTSNYVTATSYGAMPEVDAAVGDRATRARQGARDVPSRGSPTRRVTRRWQRGSTTRSRICSSSRLRCSVRARCRRRSRTGSSRSRHGSAVSSAPIHCPRRPRTSPAGWPSTRPSRHRPAWWRLSGSSATAAESGRDAQLSADDKGCRCHAPRAVARGPGRPRPSGCDPGWPCVHAVTPVVPRLLPAMAGGAPPRGRAHPGGPVQAEDALRDDHARPLTVTAARGVGPTARPRLSEPVNGLRRTTWPVRASFTCWHGCARSRPNEFSASLANKFSALLGCSGHGVHLPVRVQPHDALDEDDRPPLSIPSATR